MVAAAATFRVQKGTKYNETTALVDLRQLFKRNVDDDSCVLSKPRAKVKIVYRPVGAAQTSAVLFFASLTLVLAFFKTPDLSAFSVSTCRVFVTIITASQTTTLVAPFTHHQLPSLSLLHVGLFVYVLRAKI